MKPDVIAPGVGHPISLPGGTYGTIRHELAGPHAAGRAVLLRRFRPCRAAPRLEVLMAATAVGTPGTTPRRSAGGAIPNNTDGWGRIDALAAYNVATAPDTPPTVALTSPADGEVCTAPGSIPLVATASDDGVVAQVNFYAGGTRIATDVAQPFTATWTGVAPGNYELTAVATDDQGVSTASAPLSITVASMSPLPPPWFDQDIGFVLERGSAAAAGGVFTVAGSGQE